MYCSDVARRATV